MSRPQLIVLPETADDSSSFSGDDEGGSDFLLGARVHALTSSTIGKVTIGVVLTIGFAVHVYSLVKLTQFGVVIICMTLPVMIVGLSSFAHASIVRRLVVSFEWVYLFATAIVKFVMEVWLLQINDPPLKVALSFINACLLLTYALFFSIDAFHFRHTMKRVLLVTYVALNAVKLVQNHKMAYVDHEICLLECATLLNIRGHCILQLLIFGVRFLVKSIRRPQAAIILQAPLEVQFVSRRLDDLSAVDIGQPLLSGNSTT